MRQRGRASGMCGIAAQGLAQCCVAR
uniref:Uncharacterized protein n=1 Tax=Arundo donax TaxID=35708 RepID=A0A0A8Y894_ARUDO